MVQVDYVLVVEWDIRASKTDNLFCASPQGALLLQNQNRMVWVGARFYFSRYLLRQPAMFCNFARSMVNS
jgi:hypothetical protein